MFDKHTSVLSHWPAVFVQPALLRNLNLCCTHVDAVRIPHVIHMGGFFIHGSSRAGMERRPRGRPKIFPVLFTENLSIMHTSPCYYSPLVPSSPTEEQSWPEGAVQDRMYLLCILGSCGPRVLSPGSTTTY